MHFLISTFLNLIQLLLISSVRIPHDSKPFKFVQYPCLLSAQQKINGLFFFLLNGTLGYWLEAMVWFCM